MIDQHALHRSLTSHFKVPKKPAPKSSTQFRPSMHQRLGPPVGQEGSNQSFQNEQQNKSWNSNFFSNARITWGPLPRNPSRRSMGGGAKKTAGPSKGARQWRSVGGGLPSCFCPAMAKPARRVPIIKNPVVGYPVEVGMPPASFDKDAHSFSNQEQETRSAEGRGQPAGEGAIEPVHRSHFLGFFIRLFLVPKKTGGLRPVIDLSTLNRHLVIPYLQMETVQTVRAAVRKDKWTASIDMMYALWKKISFYNSFIVPFFLQIISCKILYFAKKFPVKVPVFSQRSGRTPGMCVVYLIIFVTNNKLRNS